MQAFKQFFSRQKGGGEDAPFFKMWREAAEQYAAASVMFSDAADPALIEAAIFDMKAAEAAQRGLMFLPLKTRIDGEEYLDGVTITHEEFYSKLEDCRDLPTTSQLTPYDYEEACQAALKTAMRF